MFLILGAFLLLAMGCELENNDPVSGINADCNNAGTCIEFFGGTNICSCCAPSQLDEGNLCGDHWICDPSNPTHECMEFSGDECTELVKYFLINIGFRLDVVDDDSPSDIICNTDPYLRATYGIASNSSINWHEQVEYVTRTNGWPGSVKENEFCDSCSPAYPCIRGMNRDLNVTSGMGFAFQVDLDEYYDVSCGVDDWITTTENDCDANYDYGQLAYKIWKSIRGNIDAEDHTFMNDVNDVLWSEPTAANSYLGLGWSNTKILGFAEEITSTTEDDVVITIPPTRAPTSVPTLMCVAYMNDVADMVFKGVGSNCRGAFDSSWPGAFTCESPYMVCLPEENTPATDGFGGEPYKSSNYRYSVEECLQECANDQRCIGSEFVADSNSIFGDCNLIGGIALEIMSEVLSFTYDSSITYTNLDSSLTGGDALCFVKDNGCYPYFQAEDLNEVMLNCYCPNNRKGYYTKKVKRTVANTRFCGDDPEVDTRIRKAQANRMFHLCENWCLFLTEDPEEESWYYDPWNGCWREQYAGVGAHKGYCNRVIRSPDAIELQFINRRSTLFCQTAQPTVSPSAMDSDWYLAEEEESCDDACADKGKVCDENLTASVIDGEESVINYFAEGGVTCVTERVGEVDWAFPGYQNTTGTCFLRNSATENTGCNWAIGVGYQRLCACV